MGFLSSIISRITSYDPNLYSIFLITSLVYILLSMVANLVFIYGIFMVSMRLKPHKTLHYYLNRSGDILCYPTLVWLPLN